VRRASVSKGRVALLFVLTPGAALLAGACGALSEGNVGTSNVDGGGGFDSGPGSDATTDAPLADSSSAQDGQAALPTTALFVQASPSLPDVRLCWGTGTAIDGVVPFPGDGAMPGSNYPGVPLGGVVAMPDATPLALPDLTLYAIDAENLARLEEGQPAPLPTCDALVCGPGSNLPSPCLRYNFDYWPVQTITGAGVLAQRDNVIALSGCLPASLDPSATPAVCGADYDATSGNLHADVLQLTATKPVGLWSVQAAQLSPALAAFEGEGGASLVSFGAENTAAAIAVATLTGEGSLAPPATVVFEAGLPGYGQLGFAVDVVGSDSGAGHLWMSLADSLQLIDPTQDPTQFFGQPRTYLVAVVGDPNAPHAFAPVTGDAGYDGKGLHVLVIAAPLPEAGTADGGADEGGEVESGAGDASAVDP
jgi:hypothetical protein